MLNRISKTVAYTTQLVLQISNVNLGNYIHVADYPNEHNISYAEIRSLLDLRISRAYASLRGYDLSASTNSIFRTNC